MWIYACADMDWRVPAISIVRTPGISDGQTLTIPEDNQGAEIGQHLDTVSLCLNTFAPSGNLVRKSQLSSGTMTRAATA